MWSCRGPEGTKSAVSREVFLGPVVCPLTMAHKVWRIGFDQVCEVLPGNALPHTTQGVQKAFGQRIGHILRSCAFQQLDMAIAHELPQIMHSSVDMPSALPIGGIFAHHNTRGIIFPYFCGARLVEN
jgi:hypothetical protein